MSEQINFGITQETRSEGTKLFNPPIKLDTPSDQFPNKYKYPVGTLVNVVANPKYETKNGEQEVVQFVFRGSKGEVFTHTEWSLDPTDAKFSGKMDAMNSRIKHILEQTKLKLPEKGIGVGAKNFEEFFADVARVFNAQVDVEGEGENKKEIKKYFKQKLYIKLIYNKKNLQFPYLPDFLQSATNSEGKPMPCNLTINPAFDKLEPEENTGTTFNNVGSGGNLGDLPDFD